MIFHIAICSPDGALRSRLEHQCMEFFARREDACIVEQLQSPEALLQQDAAGLRYELYLIELAIDTGFHHINDIVLHTWKYNLCLWIAKSRIVLQHTRTIWCQHQTTE